MLTQEPSTPIWAGSGAKAETSPIVSDPARAVPTNLKLSRTDRVGRSQAVVVIVVIFLMSRASIHRPAGVAPRDAGAPPAHMPERPILAASLCHTPRLGVSPDRFAGRGAFLREEPEWARRLTSVSAGL